MDRRQLITTGLAMCTTFAVPRIACANLQDYWDRDRTLWLRRGKSEEYRVTYWSGGKIDVPSYHRLCYLLRDKSESMTVQMHLPLLDLLYGIQYWQEVLLHRPVPLDISSGYRTRGNNGRIEGASRNSMHLHGKAADIQSPHFTPEQVAQMAAYFGMGGVGRYATHTHVDTGKVRFWSRKPK